MPSTQRLPVRAAFCVLVLPLLLGLAPAGSSGGPGGDDGLARLVHQVFPTERASQDARLKGVARTTDTVVDWEPTSDPIAWEERVLELRRQIRVATGLLPYPSAGAYYETRLQTDCGDYVIDNVLFNNHWFCFTPGNLYRPAQAAEKMPAVLVPSGWWDGSRLFARGDEEVRALLESGEERSPEAARYPAQVLCNQLARMGCLVLNFDMIGTGELDAFDRETDFRSVEHLLRSQNLLSFHFWNTYMAFNYLGNVEGADPERMAVVGYGSGGQQALLLGAVEHQRVRAVFAADALSRRDQGQLRDDNASHLRLGTSNTEFAAMLAPRALGLSGAAGATSELTARIAPGLRRIWSMYGAEEAFEATCFPESAPNLDVHVREAIYEFLNRQLGLGLESPIVEGEFEPVDPGMLLLYDPNQRVPHELEQPGPDVVRTFSELSDKQLDLLIFEETPYRVEVLQRVIGPGFQSLIGSDLPSSREVVSRLVACERGEARAILKLAIGRSGSGEEVPALLVMPDEWNGTVVVGISDRGKREFFEAGESSLAGALQVVDAGAAFLALDVLQTGEFLNPDPRTGEPPQVPFDRRRHEDYVGFTHGYNRTLIGQRVHDTLTGLGFALSLDGVRRVSLVGTGRAGGWALLARTIAGPEVDHTAVQWAWDFSEVRSFADENFLPGALRLGGLAYAAAHIAPGELTLVGGPENATAIVPPEMVERTYRASEQRENLRSVGNRRYGQVFEWLAQPAE